MLLCRYELCKLQDVCFLLKAGDEEAERVRQERLKAYEAKRANSKYLRNLYSSMYSVQVYRTYEIGFRKCHMLQASFCVYT